MFPLLLLAATVTPAPGDEPTLRPGLDPAEVTPGTLGFLATLFLVIAVIFLIRDMVKRIRRVRYRAMALEGTQDGTQEGTGTATPETAEGPGVGPAGQPNTDVPGADRPVPGGKHGPHS